MKERSKRNIKISVTVILLLLLALLAYLYFFVLQSGGGIVSAKKTTVGKIESLFSIYGPGRGRFPKFSKPMGVATDKDNNIYVTDSGNNRVCVFDRNGNFLFEFGEFGVANPQPGEKATWAPGKFSYPYGIDIDDATGNIFVCDMVNGRIQIFNSAGTFIDWFPKKPIDSGNHAYELFPLAIDVNQGKVYVTNPYQVLTFTTEGKFLTAIGMPGQEAGQFDRPNGIAAADDGSFYVSDSNNLRLQAFDAKGKSRWIVGKPVPPDQIGIMKEDPNRLFGMPRNIRVGPDGNIYLIDAFEFKIKVFDKNGKLLAAMGQRGVEDGYFNFPNGLAITNDSTLYIADKENDRVQAIRLTGFDIEK